MEDGRGLELERVDARVAEMIGAAALAGAYATLIRTMPETAGGFGKLQAKHSARVAALAHEICADARRIGDASAAI